jgi:DNA-binding transcriptional ArsR family regulator
MKSHLKSLAEKQAAICKAAGNGYRLLILWALAEKELSVSEIADLVSSSMQNVSLHLKVLSDHEIVTGRRDGQRIYYSLVEHESLKNCPALHRPSCSSPKEE